MGGGCCRRARTRPCGCGTWPAGWSCGGWRGPGGRVYGVGFCPAGRHAVSASADGTARLWDLAGGREVRCFQGHREGVVAVVVAGDGRRLLTGSWDKTARLWDVDTGKEVRTLAGHRDSVWGVALSPDGRQALTASFDRTVRLWDV